jgi:Fur family zinc uptake transcriptional regulator
MATLPSHSHGATGSPCGPSDAETFLAEAETLVQRRGQKMTPIRRKVLRLLFDAQGPAKAYDLLAHLDGEGAAKPPTIYRALEFLQEMGLAHKLESLNAYVACGHARHSHAAVFLICEHCQNVVELHAPETGASLQAEARGANFTIQRAVIEAHGLCKDCQRA